MSAETDLEPREDLGWGDGLPTAPTARDQEAHGVVVDFAKTFIPLIGAFLGILAAAFAGLASNRIRSALDASAWLPAQVALAAGILAMTCAASIFPLTLRARLRPERRWYVLARRCMVLTLVFFSVAGMSLALFVWRLVHDTPLP